MRGCVALGAKWNRSTQARALQVRASHRAEGTRYAFREGSRDRSCPLVNVRAVSEPRRGKVKVEYAAGDPVGLARGTGDADLARGGQNTPPRSRSSMNR